MSKTDDRLDIEMQNRAELREIEEFYTNGTVSNMLEKIEEQKDIICEEIKEYANKKYDVVKWDRDGNPIEYKVKFNPLVVDNNFFKPITKIRGVEPIYNAEQLGLIYDYYCYVLAEVNDKIGDYPASLTSFCKMAGITSTSLRRYKNSEDYNMQVVVEKIYDEIGDTNLTMGQLGKVKERTTLFKMRSQNEMVEKEQPKVNVNINTAPDFNSIEAKINKYKNFANKKG